MLRNNRIAVAITTVTTLLSPVFVASTVARADVPCTRDHLAVQKCDLRMSKHDDIPAGLRSAITLARMRETYAIKTITSGKDGVAYEAINRPNDLRFTFKPDGMIVSPNASGTPAWQLRMMLRSYAYEDAGKAPTIMPARHTVMSVDGNRIEYRHTFGTGDLTASGDSHVGRVLPASVLPSNSRRVEPALPRLVSPSDSAASIVEWYINDARGLEQGFTLTAPPKRRHDSSSLLRLELGIEGAATSNVTADGVIRFADSRGKTVLRYSQLHVFDATGTALPAHLALSGQSNVAIVMNDRGAVYPLTIDPLFDAEVKITASDAAASDKFGFSVSISGDTAIVGAWGDDDAGGSSGSAYIFQRDLGGLDNWGEVTKLTASDAAASDSFGYSVSISGDTAIVGARFNADVGSFTGSAYIFQRDLGGLDNWGEVTKLLASDMQSGDEYGRSVSISGDTAIVGANRNGDAGGASGSAYILERNLGGADNWGELLKLTASDASGADEFGESVSIDGDLAIVGARRNDDDGANSGSAYIFERNLGGASQWNERAKLTASDAAADDEFGESVSINGDTAIVGASFNDDAGANSGSAHIFQRDQGGAFNWGEVTKLTASDTAAGDHYGESVSIGGDTAIVGAFGDDGATGSVYILQRNQGGADNWGEVTKLAATDAAAGDSYGDSVSISGGTAFVGAPSDDDDGSNSGSAYIYFTLPFCGDGNTDSGEICDDGNNADCDGCRGDCSAVEGICGDGAFDMICEVCDDNNTADCDGCRGDCFAVETGCNDGFVCGAEACDDGNNADCDGCRGDCSAIEGICGDGAFDPLCEACDDNNTDLCDGCDASCEIEDCDDGVACTADSCDLVLGCQHDTSACIQSPVALTGEPGFDKDRYVSFDATANGTSAVATRITRVGSTTDKFVDCTSLEDKGADGWYATLIDGPLPAPPDATYYCDLSGVTTGLHVRGCSVVPGNTYDIAMTTDGSSFSAALSIPTTPPAPPRNFGDMVGSFVAGNWTAPEGIVTTNDIVAAVKKFGLDPDAAVLARLDTEGSVPNAVMSSGDILRAVRAFAGDFFGSGVTGCTTGTCVPPPGVGNCEIND